MPYPYPVIRKDRPIPVLIVEDDADCQFLIEHGLRASISLVAPIFVATPNEAITHLSKSASEIANFPRLVLLDLHIPSLDQGWQLLQEMRTSYNNLPILILSGDNNPQTVRQAYNLGANSYIVKPALNSEWETCFKILYTYWLGTVTLPPFF